MTISIEQPLQGKVALITGGGRGIGRAIAIQFAKAGADIAVCARTVDQVNGVAAEVRQLGRNAFAAACDVTDYDAVEATIGEAAAELGRLEILECPAALLTANLALAKRILDRGRGG